MCEYCGCQEITAIAELTREHEEVVALVSVARTQIREGRLADLPATCRAMLEVLRPHTAVEEEGLFPAMAKDFPEHVATLVGEHRAIEKVLVEGAAIELPADPAWPDRLLAALHELRAHILKEQDGVFPAALSTLRPDEWERLDELRTRFAALADPISPTRG